MPHGSAPRNASAGRRPRDSLGPTRLESKWRFTELLLLDAADVVVHLPATWRWY